MAKQSRADVAFSIKTRNASKSKQIVLEKEVAKTMSNSAEQKMQTKRIAKIKRINSASEILPSENATGGVPNADIVTPHNTMNLRRRKDRNTVSSVPCTAVSNAMSSQGKPVVPPAKREPECGKVAASVDNDLPCKNNVVSQCIATKSIVEKMVVASAESKIYKKSARSNLKKCAEQTRRLKKISTNTKTRPVKSLHFSDQKNPINSKTRFRKTKTVSTEHIQHAGPVQNLGCLDTAVSLPRKFKKCVVKLKRVKPEDFLHNNGITVVRTTNPGVITESANTVQVEPSSSNLFTRTKNVYKLPLRGLNIKNRKNLIEQILLSDDDVESNNNDDDQNGKCTSEICRQPENPPTRQKRIFHKTEDPPKPTTPGCQSSVGNAFEYPSQSESFGIDANHTDPAADIVKKLIEEGKVAVATRRKGAGKPTIKRERKERKPKTEVPKCATKGKRQKETAEILEEQDEPHEFRKSKRKPARVQFAEECAAVAEQNEGDWPATDQALRDEDDFWHGDNPESPHEDEIDNATPAPIPVGMRNVYKKITNQEQISPMARCVLLNQMRKRELNSRTMVTDSQQLLSAARKHVSTPVNKGTFSPPRESLLSPIDAPTPSTSTAAAHNRRRSATHQMTASSPWRVDDTAHLPRVFQFTTANTSHLPSFSSDYIPSSPPDEDPINQCNVSVQPAQEAEESLSTSSLPSFSLNDSNAENVPPPKTSRQNDHNYNNLSRPPPGHRSPLKTIQVTDIVTLTPWKTVEKSMVEAKESNEPAASNTTVIDSSIEKDSLSSPSTGVLEDNGAPVAGDQLEQSDLTEGDLFGFDDLIDHAGGEDKSDVDTESILETSVHDLRDRLCDLKKLLTESCGPTSPTAAKIAGVFDEDEGRPKQRNLKDMFCSTPKPGTSKETAQKYQYFSSDDDDDFDVVVDDSTRAAAEVELFNDPELTFDEKKPIRTYINPGKRKKRKTTHHQFVMCLTSDESDEDERECEGQKRKKTHPKSKKQRKEDVQHNEELDAFADQFNKMCEEVEKEELIVE